ncbi:MAG: ribose 5-phosphate isomerase B [Bacillota bacterium]
MKVAIGADHGGVDLKEKIITYLKEQKIEYTDYGTNNSESCDYNEPARAVSLAVSEGQADRGILICGTGIGMSIQANKVHGIRAALVHDLYTAKATRLHNDSNVLAMGGRIIGDEIARAIVDIWLHTEFSGVERHERRVSKIEE